MPAPLDPSPPVPPQRLAWTALIASLLLTTVVGVTVVPFSVAAGLWINELFCILGVAWALTRWSGRAPAAYTRLSWPGFPAVFFAMALSVANFFGLAGPIEALTRHLAPPELRDTFDIFQLVGGLAPLELWTFAAAAVIGAAFCEEFLFRGVVQQGLSTPGGHPAQAVVRTALFFAVFHFSPVDLPALFELGLLFGFLYLKTGSLVPGMAAHAAQNATAFGLYFLEKHSDLPEATTEPGAAQLLGVAGMGIVVLVMLLQVAKAFPSVWGRPPAIPGVDAVAVDLPRVSLSRAVAPWLVAVSIFALGWLSMDRRGVELSMVDRRVPLPAPLPSETPEVRSAREALQALRRRVRSGEATLRTYREARQALLESLAHPAQASPANPP